MKTSIQYPKLMMVVRHGEKPGDTFCLEQTVELREQNRNGIEARCRAGKFVIAGEDN